MALFTVTNLNNTGAGYLRQAIVDVNGAAGADTIDFAAEVCDESLIIKREVENG